jgi:hypothetical protein
MDIARENDLTSKMAPYLDVHMISPLLDFLREVIQLIMLYFIVMI